MEQRAHFFIYAISIHMDFFILILISNETVN